MECKYIEHQINIRANGQYRLCCVSMEPDNLENIKTHTPKEWRNSKTYLTAKEQLRNDQWPDACIKCKTQEEKGVQSKRTKAKIYGPGISHLDLRFGNSCNLKCISCWNMSSSSIAEEEKAMAKSGIKIPQVLDITNFNWASDENFKKLEHLPIQEVYLTGGEPMMVCHLPNFLDRLDPSTQIRFNTNCTIHNPKLEKTLKKFHTVSMSLSIDAVDQKIEYIRYGCKWDEVEENAKRFADNFMVDISPTISLLNAWFYQDIKEYADMQGWKVFENLLISPEWLHCKNAPKSLKQQFQIVDPKWYEEEVDPSKIKLFLENIQRIDNWRNVRIKDYLPEVAKCYGID